jgi:hypothetical protein
MPELVKCSRNSDGAPCAATLQFNAPSLAQGVPLILHRSFRWQIFLTESIGILKEFNQTLFNNERENRPSVNSVNSVNIPFVRLCKWILLSVTIAALFMWYKFIVISEINNVTVFH